MIKALALVSAGVVLATAQGCAADAAPTLDDPIGGPYVVRCNPVSGPPLCVDEDVEGPLGGAR